MAGEMCHLPGLQLIQDMFGIGRNADSSAHLRGDYILDLGFL
jgi:hypothetical protein